MKQKITGGKGDKLNAKDVDQNELKIGIEIEKEHTTDPKLAKEIALDHLAEDPKYYTKLKKAKLEHKMSKSKIIKLIEDITIREMARIPSLVQLSTTDKNEILNKLTPELKASGITNQIIDYLINNNNTPTTVIAMAKSFGYAAQQPINTQVQKLKALGILQDKGLAFAKQDRTPNITRAQHQQNIFQGSSDIDKLEYIIKHKKQEIPIPDMFVNWFVEKHGQDKYDELDTLVQNWHFAKTKEELTSAKQNIKAFINGLGYKIKQASPTPKRLPPDDQGFEKIVYDDEDLDEKKNQPLVAPPKPGIKSPSKPTPKRRTLTPPDPNIKPNPKNENKGMLKKIVDRYSKLK